MLVVLVTDVGALAGWTALFLRGRPDEMQRPAVVEQPKARFAPVAMDAVLFACSAYGIALNVQSTHHGNAVLSREWLASGALFVSCGLMLIGEVHTRLLNISAKRSPMAK